MMFAPLPRKKYGVILMDPPWSFKTYSKKVCTKAGEAHYDTMRIEDLHTLDVASLAAKDCCLFMWVVDSLLPKAISMGFHFGFEFKTTAFTWTKRTKNGKEHLGLGYWTRRNPEQCLLFTRGKPKRKSAGVRQWIESPVREHSRKPDVTYERIESLVDGPYLEMFARSRRQGWDVWGNQCDMFVPAPKPSKHDQNMLWSEEK